MKKLFCLAAVLLFVATGLVGCAEPGESRAEAKRRHWRVLRTNMSTMGEDIDAVLLLDEPSKLTERRIP